MPSAASCRSTTFVRRNPAWSVPGPEDVVAHHPSPAASTSCSVFVEACPMCSEPVMFRGWDHHRERVPGASGSARKSSRCSTRRTSGARLDVGRTPLRVAQCSVPRDFWAVKSDRRAPTRAHALAGGGVGAVLMCDSNRRVSHVSRSRRLSTLSGPAPGARRHLSRGPMTLKVGKDNTTAGARRCKLVLTHTIETVANGKITRVHLQHLPRAACLSRRTPGTKATSARPARIVGSARARRPRSGRRDPAATQASQYASLLRGRTPRRRIPYVTSGRYKVSELIAHPTFGVGADHRRARQREDRRAVRRRPERPRARPSRDRPASADLRVISMTCWAPANATRTSRASLLLPCRGCDVVKASELAAPDAAARIVRRKPTLQLRRDDDTSRCWQAVFPLSPARRQARLGARTVVVRCIDVAAT